MARLSHKVILKGVLTNTSPLLIGSGKGGNIDAEIVKDENGKVYIPGSSFLGALKHYICDHFEVPSSVMAIFGERETQSQMVVQDLVSLDSFQKISVRDGVRIDPEKGIAQPKKKYDYEILEPGSKFQLLIEMTILEEPSTSRELPSLDDSLKLIKTILEILSSEESDFSLGAITTKGFGKVAFDTSLKNETPKIYCFDFPDKGKAWFEYLLSEDKIPPDHCLKKAEEIKAIVKKQQDNLEIVCNMSIVSSLLIGASPKAADEEDKVTLKSGDLPVISGTSLKGALRARAERIYKTLAGKESNKEKLHSLFGWVSEKEKLKIKSKMIVEETIVQGGTEVSQPRIKIDRFTGGVIEGALMETKALWRNDEDISFKICVRDPENWEVGLLLLVIKDLWDRDLPIGGEKAIGRGVLKGDRLQISLRGKTYSVVEKNGILNVTGEQKELEEYVNAFVEYAGGEQQ
ncbi:MAG TPA: hypothetical protein DCE14_08665 [Kosmotogaceae bacterium]|nr:hypothetical protein [Kosmotogaceae bacterium]